MPSGGCERCRRRSALVLCDGSRVRTAVVDPVFRRGCYHGGQADSGGEGRCICRDGGKLSLPGRSSDKRDDGAHQRVGGIIASSGLSGRERNTGCRGPRHSLVSSDNGLARREGVAVPRAERARAPPGTPRDPVLALVLAAPLTRARPAPSTIGNGVAGDIRPLVEEGVARGRGGRLDKVVAVDALGRPVGLGIRYLPSAVEPRRTICNSSGGGVVGGREATAHRNRGENLVRALFGAVDAGLVARVAHVHHGAAHGARARDAVLGASRRLVGLHLVPRVVGHGPNDKHVAPHPTLIVVLVVRLNSEGVHDARSRQGEGRAPHCGAVGTRGRGVDLVRGER